MTARAPVWVLILALAAPMPLQGQDITTRPMPRPASQTAAPINAAPAVKPLPRPASETGAAPVAATPIGAASLGQKPLPRPNVTSTAISSAPPETTSADITPITDTTPRPKARALAQVDTVPAPILPAPTVPAPTLPVGSIASSPFPTPRPKALVAAVAAVAAAPTAPEGAGPAPSKPNLIQLLFGAGSGAKLPKTQADEADEELASAAPAPTMPTKSAPATSAPRKGSVCGDRAIRGEKIKPITSSVKGCGVAEPVRVTEVAGIKLSQAVTVECDTVIALKDWIDSAMRPAFGNREVVQLRIAAHYACRGRNNKRGARVSEHGKGRALDISGFIFADGTEWSIGRDYNKQIRKAHQGACGIFGTTLGPGSDGYHEDHLHFDTARYRSGTYCR